MPYHPATQPPGTTEQQVAHIDRYLPDGHRWGVCTECGMGRFEREDVLPLLDLHRQIVASATSPAAVS